MLNDTNKTANRKENKMKRYYFIKTSELFLDEIEDVNKKIFDYKYIGQEACIRCISKEQALSEYMNAIEHGSVKDITNCLPETIQLFTHHFGRSKLRTFNRNNHKWLECRNYAVVEEDSAVARKFRKNFCKKYGKEAWTLRSDVLGEYKDLMNNSQPYEFKPGRGLTLLKATWSVSDFKRQKNAVAEDVNSDLGKFLDSKRKILEDQKAKYGV